MRLVFVADKPDGTTGLQAFELPLAYISEEDFKQPIFFANNLSGRCGGRAVGGRRRLTAACSLRHKGP